jgi:hypothetical protein
MPAKKRDMTVECTYNTRDDIASLDADEVTNTILNKVRLCPLVERIEYLCKVVDSPNNRAAFRILMKTGEVFVVYSRFWSLYQ